MQFHKWAPYPGTTVMNLDNCILPIDKLPNKIPLSNKDIIDLWTSPQIYYDDGSYKGGEFAPTNLPLSDNQWATGCSIEPKESSNKITFELIKKGIINPAQRKGFGPFEASNDILPGSEEWAWSGNITMNSGKTYSTYVCFCHKTFEETGKIIPMPQIAYDVLLGVVNHSDGTDGQLIIKMGARKSNPSTDIGNGALISGAGETKTYADHKKLSTSVKRAIEEELGIDFTNVKKAKIYNLGIRDDNGRDSRYNEGSIMGPKRNLIKFGHSRYSKTNVYSVLLEFNDPNKKDLPFTDVDEIESTAWIALSDALKIPPYKFFIPENATYLTDLNNLLIESKLKSEEEINLKYNVCDLRIEE